MNAAVQRRLVIGLITLATLNALLWSVIAAPGGGGPDEPSHMRIVRTMLATGGLAEFRGYSPGAFAGGPVRAQVAHEITPNAFAVPVAAVLGLLGSDDDAFNHHMARLFSVALYPVTLWLAFLTLRRLFVDMPVAPVWGVALMATAPMFTLVHSYYTNDTPAIAASTFAVYALVRASQSDFALRDSALLGVALGLVGLHKYTGFLVFPVAALVLVWQLWRQPARLLRTGGAMLGIVAAIASWWYVRNWVLYGDPIGVAFTQAAVDATGGAPVPPRARGLNPVEFVQETNWIGENFATFWGRIWETHDEAARCRLSRLQRTPHHGGRRMVDPRRSCAPQRGRPRETAASRHHGAAARRLVVPQFLEQLYGGRGAARPLRLSDVPPVCRAGDRRPIQRHRLGAGAPNWLF